MPKYTISLETPPEPDHIATFPETQINLAGQEKAQFQIYQKNQARQLTCTFQTGEEDDMDETAQQIVYAGNEETSAIVTAADNDYERRRKRTQPTFCVLYVDKLTGQATLRPVLVHNLVSQKEEVLDRLEAQIMDEKNLNQTIENDERTRLQKQTDYTHTFGSKVQKTMLQNANLLKSGTTDSYVTDMVVNKMSTQKSKNPDTDFSTSDGESSTCPPRDITAKKVDKVYIFKNLLPAEVLDNLAYHTETCVNDDPSFVSSYYGQVMSYLYTIAFTTDVTMKGSHLNENDRNSAYSFMTLLVRIFKVFRVVNNRTMITLSEEKMDEYYWDNFKVGQPVKDFINSQFLAFNRDTESYILPSHSIDKLQAWILVLALLMTNFRIDLKPFTDFFQVTSKVFEKVVRVIGASIPSNEGEKRVVLRVPLVGIDSMRSRKRK